MSTRPLLPNSYVNFLDNQLAKSPTPNGIFIFVGPGNGSATVGELTAINSPNDIQNLFGIGPLARDLVTFFLEGAGFCYAVQLAEATAGDIGTVTVGAFTGLVAGGTSHNAYKVRGRCVVGGALGEAQVKYSIDDGRNWSSAQVLKSGANVVYGSGNFNSGITVTPTAMTYVKDPTDLTEASDSDFTFTTVPPMADPAAILAAMTTQLADPTTTFNAFHVSGYAASTAADLASFASDMQALLETAVTDYDRDVYATIHGPVPDSQAGAATFARAVRAAFAGNRVQFYFQPMVTKSLGGQFTMIPSAVGVSRRAQLDPQNELGIVSAGQLNTLVDFADGWTQAGVIALDQIENNVTFRKFRGLAGFYPTNGWMSDPTSDYSRDNFRQVADLCATDVRVAGLPFVKMDVDPSNPAKSAKGLLAVCGAPLSVRVIAGQIASYTLTIPSNQDILTSKELAVEVAIKPMATADWIKFNVGFKSPFTGT